MVFPQKKEVHDENEKSKSVETKEDLFDQRINEHLGKDYFDLAGGGRVL